jgi:hypothetical protein
MNLSDLIIDIFIISWLAILLFWFPILVCILVTLVILLGVKPDWDWARYALLNIILFAVGFVVALFLDFFGATGPQ